jgi:hypothetical protein
MERGMYFSTHIIALKSNGGLQSIWVRWEPSRSIKARVIEELRFSRGMSLKNHCGGLINMSPSQTGLQQSSLINAIVVAGLLA